MIIVGEIKQIAKQLATLDGWYRVEVTQPKAKRSVEQNKLLWKLIHAIAKETSQSDYDVYCAILEKADAKSDYIIVATDMEQYLRETFRAVKFIRFQQVGNKKCYVYKVYFGSSLMDTGEMSELLSVAQGIASEYGIYYGA